MIYPHFLKKIKEIIAASLAIALVIMASGCSTAETEQQTAAITVETEKPVISTLSKEASFSATLRPQAEIAVSPKVAGTVTGVIAGLGDYVEKGDALFVIDDKDLSLQLEQAYSGVMTARANYEMLVNGQLDQNLQAAKSALENAKMQLEAAQTNYDNTLALFEVGASSKQQLDAAERQLRSAKLAVETAQESYNSTKDAINPASEQTALSALKQAQAAYDLAASNASNAIVQSPISGYITQNSLTDGMLVSPQTPAMVVSDISTLVAELSVTQNMIPNMSAGQKVTAELSSVSDKRVEGTIVAVSQSANSTTGVFSVRVEIPNKDHLIKGGMFARIFVPMQTVKDALTVPVSAVLHDDSGDYVFVKENDRAVRRSVTVGLSTDTRCQISSGLSKDDLVIVKGQTYISDNSSVVTPQELDAQKASSTDAEKDSDSQSPDSSGVKAG